MKLMSITKLISDIPTVANLSLKVKELEAKDILSMQTIANLKSQLEQAQMEIERLKKVPKPPAKITWNGIPGSSDNMI